MITKCTCKSTQQDKLHGKNRRVKNEMHKEKGQSPKYRCTVCLKEG